MKENETLARGKRRRQKGNIIENKNTRHPRIEKTILRMRTTKDQEGTLFKLAFTMLDPQKDQRASLKFHVIEQHCTRNRTDTLARGRIK
jgi:Zn-dependent M16 (insulinase) family peptidase